MNRDVNKLISKKLDKIAGFGEFFGKFFNKGTIKSITIGYAVITLFWAGCVALILGFAKGVKNGK
jgi:hypothetical protein